MDFTFEKTFLIPLLSRQNSDRIAFCIKDVQYSYSDLFSFVEQIFDEVYSIPEQLMYIYSIDDIRTYASIIALWYAGKGYVVLNPVQPKERHGEIIESVGAHYVLTADEKYNAGIEGIQYIQTSKISIKGYSKKHVINIQNYPSTNIVYIIFTSGSTGKPKGVQINRRNLAAFLISFDGIGLAITEEDRCLQPFDLSFDASIESYVFPLFKGASVFTIPEKKTKYLYIAYLLEKYHLTFLHMVPSMVRNLIPYIDEVERKCIRYNLFGGEALTTAILNAWHKDCKDMISYNIYGPTENTDICACYMVPTPSLHTSLHNVGEPLNHNDVISIGKTFGYTKSLLLNEDDCVITEEGVIGELCLCGEQLTSGYWNNPNEDAVRFILVDGERYYKTGDLCYYGEGNNLMFVNRKDFQIKINGFRVETGEIESKYFEISGGIFSVVLPYNDGNGNLSLAIIIEGKDYDYKNDKAALAKVLPAYEVPTKWLFIDKFPLNVSGKVDRIKLKDIFNL